MTTEANVHKLKKPIIYDEKEITELKYDFEVLTGKDLVDAEQELLAHKYQVTVAELSKPYHAIVFAKAAKIPFEMVLQLGVKDFSDVTMVAQDFLLD